MTKSIVAIATVILAMTTLLTSTAQAGMRVHLGFGGLPPYLTDYNKESAYERRSARKHYRAARRHEQAPVRAAKKAKPESVAKAEPKVEEAPEKLAETENSSISVASISDTKADAQPETASADEAVKTAAATPSEPEARSLDCKKFFPAAGMTLSVPCE